MNPRRYLAAALLFTGLGCRDDADSPTEPHMAPKAAAAIAALDFRQLSAGAEYTCGVTVGDRAYCWGNEFPGTLGNGSPGEEFCMDWDRCVPQPVAVVGGLVFRNVSAGRYHTCGATGDDRAYCWGNNSSGQLGIGNATGPRTCAGNESAGPCSTSPVAVQGGLRFRTVSTGGNHTCGLTADGLAYCWGANFSGQLGDGTSSNRITTRAVAGGRRFRQVSAGFAYTCGVTLEDRAYCWGDNSFGQLGDSTRVTRRLRPVRVAGGRRFRQLDAGLFHACGVTPGKRAFCWGRGDNGQLGTGKILEKGFWPNRVAGSLSLSRVTAGDYHTCGEATDDRAFCWGDNFYGQLGDGTRTQRLGPVAIAGGLSFSQVTAGENHSCGRTGSGAAYCWGRNSRGQVGDGTTEGPRLTPVAVVGP